MPNSGNNIHEETLNFLGGIHASEVHRATVRFRARDLPQNAVTYGPGVVFVSPSAELKWSEDSADTE